MSKSDADIMAEAREYIETHGWWKGHLRGPNKRQVCGVGAVVYSQGWIEEHSPNLIPPQYNERVHRIMNKVLAVTPWGKEREVGSYGTDFTYWNDNVASKQEVLDAFAKAEKIERTGFDPDEGLEISDG